MPPRVGPPVAGRKRRLEHRVEHDRPIQIRPSSIADVEPLADLMRQEVELQVRVAGSLELAPDIDWRRYASEKLARQDAAVLVAEVGGAVVGFTDVRVIGQARQVRRNQLVACLRRLVRPRSREPMPIVRPHRRGYIDDVYVTPSARSFVMSLRLFQAAIEWLRDRQVSEVEGAIWADNQRSLRLAEHVGFKATRVLVTKSL
ncbi:MAG: GNAT family N-acetyltransferase [Chloroflexi bacterium]|nr:GNAT family N-acetyltransferase [Chloroflexota bacterium]